MKEGMAIIEQTREGARSVFIDQEVLDCARLNMRTKKRIAESEAKQNKADQIRQKEKAAKVQFVKDRERTANRVLLDVVFGGAVAAAGTVGLIHPVIWTPTAIICLCVASLRLGAWFGRTAHE